MLDLVRGLVRPTLTWLGFISLPVFLVLKIPIPDWYQIMVVSMITFWFVDRKNGHENSNGVAPGAPKP